MISTRLSVIDEIFLRTHRGYGIPIALQGIWRTSEILERSELERVHANLSVGRLGRRVTKPRVPLARLRWDPSTAALPLVYSRDPTDDVIAWADTQADVPLDPQHGPGWRLTATPVTQGGSVLSLVCSHALADARGLINAAGQAFSGITYSSAAPLPDPDLRDAILMARTVIPRSLRASARVTTSSAGRAELRSFTDSRRRAQPVTVVRSVVVDIDAAEWEDAARAAEGSPNSLFIAVVADIMARLGCADVTVNIPFGTASGDANSIGMAAVTVRQSDSLSQIKAACKAAFGRPVGAPAGFPPEVVQLLPQRLAAKLTSIPGRGEVLCSNIGDIPESVSKLGPHLSSGLATRAVHPLAVGHSSTTRLSTYISRMNGVYTLSLVAADASLVGSTAALTAATLDALARRNLTGRPW